MKNCYLHVRCGACQMFVLKGLMIFEVLMRKLTNVFVNRLTISNNDVVRALLDNMVARDSMWKYWDSILC